jgi:hypothetical protein
MNGWFPKVSPAGHIVAGDTSVWIRRADGSESRLAAVGGTPVWVWDDVIAYSNRAEGAAARVLLQNTAEEKPLWDIPRAFNQLAGSGTGRWAGFSAAGNGRIETFAGRDFDQAYESACCPSYLGDYLTYLSPYQPGPTGRRILVVNNIPQIHGVFMEAGGSIAIEATGMYTRRMFGTPTLVDDESNLVVQDGWVCTTSTKVDGLLIRPIGGVSGYILHGEWFNPHFRVIGPTLLLAASTSGGVLRTASIPLISDRIDLRTAVPVPPTPVPTGLKHPEVTVDLFGFTFKNQLADGEYLRFHDRENLQGATVRVWVENSSMYMSIEYPGIGKGQSGAFRRVR